MTEPATEATTEPTTESTTQPVAGSPIQAPRTATPGPAAGHKRPLYPRLLRLRNVSPNAWQRAVLGEGALAVAILLVLADVATAWTLIVLPLAVAAVVKAHDLLAGALRSGRAAPPGS